MIPIKGFEINILQCTGNSSVECNAMGTDAGHQVFSNLMADPGDQADWLVRVSKPQRRTGLEAHWALTVLLLPALLPAGVPQAFGVQR